MKWASWPSAYRNCSRRTSVRTERNFSPARKVLSITLPSLVRRSLVRTNAAPLPGLTCWNSRTLKIVPSTSMWLPFLSWFVEIIYSASLVHGPTDIGGRCGRCAPPFRDNDVNPPLGVDLDRIGDDAQPGAGGRLAGPQVELPFMPRADDDRSIV